MNWYGILGISEDSDLKTIKKAYAKLIKIYNPEEDAEGYQRLREAYDQAIKYAKKNNKSKNTQEFDNYNLNENIYKNEKNINEKEVNENKNVKFTVDKYIDYISNDKDEKHVEVNENKNEKSTVDEYMDYINNDKDESYREINENKNVKSTVDTYIDYINCDKEKKVRESDENKTNKSKVDSYLDYINYEDDKTGNENKLIIFNKNSSIDNVHFKEQNSEINVNQNINKFLDRLNKIYNHMFLRLKPEVWEELLNCDVMWNVQSYQIIKGELFEFLMNHRNLPKEVWAVLNNNFNWSDSEINLYKKYPAEAVDEIFKNLRNDNNDFQKSDSSNVYKSSENIYKTNSKRSILSIIYIAVILIVVSIHIHYSSVNDDKNVNNKSSQELLNIGNKALDSMKTETDDKITPDLEPKVIVTSYLTNLRNLDISKASRYTVDNVSGFEKIKQQIDSQDTSKVHYNEFFKKMMDFDYSVDDVEINGDKATAQIKLKTYNFITEVMNARLNISDATSANHISGGKKSDEEIAQKELGKIFSEMQRKLEKQVKLTLTKTDDGWRIDNTCINDELYEDITSNLINSINYYNEFYKNPGDTISMKSYCKFLESKGINYDENSKTSPFESKSN